MSVDERMILELSKFFVAGGESFSSVDLASR